MSFLRKMFGGSFSDDDPRRFLVETMLAAMEADGDVTEQELDVLQQNLDEHELFQGMTGNQTSRLIDIAAQAIKDAGGGLERTADIARGLPSRSHRLTAYALACEICVSDSDLPEAEIRFLEGLQRALELGDEEAREIFEAARQQSGLMTVEEQTQKMLKLLPQLVHCMALMAMADDVIQDQERETMRLVLGKIPDMAVLTSEELNEAINVGFERAAEGDRNEQLTAIAKEIESSTDRYWTAAYMMIVALADGKTDWREVGFLETVQTAFELSDDQMDRAMATASLFPDVDLGG